MPLVTAQSLPGETQLNKQKLRQINDQGVNSFILTLARAKDASPVALSSSQPFVSPNTL
jgi:hypothetical protein